MSMIDYEKTGKLIAELRKEKGMTQAQLAEKLGVTDRAVSKWERGKSFPDVGILQELAGILDLSVGELLDGELSQREKNKIAEASRDEMILKGMKSSLEVIKKANRENGKKLLVVLLILAMLSIYPVYQYLHRPIDFEKKIPDYTSVTSAQCSGQSLSAAAEDDAGQELKDAVVPILRQIKSSERQLMENAEDVFIMAPYVYLKDVAYFMPDYYYDCRSDAFYTFPDVAGVYEKLYSICYDYVMDYNFQHWGNRDYEYTGDTTFSNGKAAVNLDCDLTEYPQELVLESLKLDMDKVIEPSKPDAYIKEMNLQKIRRVYQEEYEATDEYDALRKEIEYYDIYDFRIYEAEVNFAYTEAYKELGPQHPEGTRKLWYMVGKKYDGTEYELCYTINIGYVKNES